MADDIVAIINAQLAICQASPCDCTCPILIKAADEIERLRARLATADDLIEGLLDQYCQDADMVDDWWSNFITINAEAIRYMDSIGRCIAETNNSRVAYGRRQTKEARRG